MGKSTPATPPTPDPVAISQAQGTANKDTAVASARLNAVNSNTPYGSVSYSETPNANDASVPTFTQNVTLSPDQQKLFDMQNGIQQQAYGTAGQALNTAQNTLSTPFSLNNLPTLQTGVNGGAVQTGYNAVSPLFGIAPAGNVQSGLNTGNLPGVPLTANDFAKQGQQAFDATMSRFNQDFPKQQEAAISRLNAEGLQRGSAAYDTGMDQLDRSRNDAIAQATLTGNNVQNNLFNQALSSRGQVFGEDQAQGNFANSAQAQQFGQNQDQAGFYNQSAAQQTANNQAQFADYNTAQAQQFAQMLQNAGLNNQGRQQSISEQQLIRSQPINEIATLLGLGGGIQTPNAAPNFGVNVGNTDVLGAYGLQQQNLQNTYNQKMAANNAITGAIGNLLGSAGSAAMMKFG